MPGKGAPIPSVPESVPPLRQTIADLLSAADLLESGGWCQNTGTIGTKHCAGHAILEVTGSLNRSSVTKFGPEASQRANRAYAALAAHLELPSAFYVSQWNDAAGRTVEEVLSALRGTAAGLTEGVRR